MASIERILEELWRRSRFVSYFYQTVHCIADEGIPTLALAPVASRFTLYYNRDFIESLDREHAIGLLVHEMMHIVLSHDHRSLPGADAHLQNLAQDMIINTYLTASESTFFSRKGKSPREIPALILPPGLPMVPDAFFDSTGMRDPRWEDVYRWLLSRGSGEYYSFDGNLDLSAGMGPDSGASVIASHEQDFELAAPWNQAPRAVLTPLAAGGRDAARGRMFTDEDGHTVPTGVHLYTHDGARLDRDATKKKIMSLALRDILCTEERAFTDITALIRSVEKIDTEPWRSLMKSIVDYSSQSSTWTTTYSRFNKRYFANNIYAPGRVFRENQVLTVVVDVSASMVMKPGEIEAAFGVVEDLLRKYTVYLLCIDEQLFVPEKQGDAFVASHDLTKPYKYKKGDWQYLRSGASGTTFFAPLFNGYLHRHREMVVVITDGYIYDLQSLKKYTPTLWVISGGRTEPFAPPFGQVVSIG